MRAHTLREPAIDFLLGLNEAQTQKHSFPAKLRLLYAEMQDVNEAHSMQGVIHDIRSIS